MHPNGIMTKLDPMVIPAMQHPTYRTALAVQNKVANNLLFRTWGGLGDQICAEPTLRYALKSFKHSEVSLTSEKPELFSHLKFKEVFDERRVRPNLDNYLLFETITPPDQSNLVWQFFSHMLTNCVDFPSMCALRCQLPVADREVILKPSDADFEKTNIYKNAIVIHPGKHWPSKTFPKDFWDGVIEEIISNRLCPIIIGANTDDNRGTVDVSTDGCIDLRNKLSVMECVALLQNAKVLLTNDSSPLHMAVTGDAHIGFIATCKHPDYISHWRKGEWAWRMKNFGKGGIWDLVDYCPNTDKKLTADFVEPEILRSWLPDPKDYARWAIERTS